MATDLTALSGSVQVTVRMTTAKALDLSTPTDEIVSQVTNTFSFGNGANQANQLWHDRRILAASANDDLNLAGSLTNAYGNSVTFANVKGIVVINRSGTVSGAHSAATDAGIIVGGAASAQFAGMFGDVSDKQNVPVDTPWMAINPAADGWAVTGTSADVLRISNADGSDEAMYDIIIWGEAA